MTQHAFSAAEYNATTMRLMCVSFALLFAACKVKEPGLTVLATAEDAALIGDGIDYVGDARIHLKVVANPTAELASREGVVVALSRSSELCDECYRLEGRGTLLHARGGGVLGRQYALWNALEALGYRFPHPRFTKKPTEFASAPADALDRTFEPEVKRRRGLHLHTLHPVETMYDFWIPGAGNLDGAKRTIDFVVKNRGNFLEWCALDDIMQPQTLAAWKPHTRAIVDFAHAHGVKTGIAIQLFGQSNLQNAFDLIDDTTGDPVPELERRLHLLLDESGGFDLIALSFGEFFGAEPARFVAEVDSAYAAMQRVSPGVAVSAAIHVGNFDNLRVDYMGERQLYYFLVRYANPAIVPWVHTTMWFNLYEDAGLAYLHDQFDEHRAFLEARLRAGQTAGYYPESAYWVAFDINIPLFAPVYVRSRHLDLAQLARAGQLDDHVLFSSGWEWGYWLTDATTLRMSYTTPAAWDDSVRDVYGGWGAEGVKAASLISRLGEAQHRALILERLAAYAASRDQIIDTGDQLGIFSQPDRPEFSEVLAMSPTAKADFRTRVVARLKVHADELAVLSSEADALPSDDPVLAELKDGLQVTAARIAFVHALFGAAADGDPALLNSADASLARAREVVARRRRALWDPDPLSILRNNANPTFYQYGYLREGDTLCFWERERAQARNALLAEGNFVPGCVL